MAMLSKRRDRLGEFTPALFPTVQMKRKDPSNTQREVRESRDSLGYPDLSTRSFRKTVATILGTAGMSANEVADYLGHENPSLTMETCMHTLRGDAEPARVLEQQLMGPLTVQGFAGCPTVGSVRAKQNPHHVRS